MKTSLHIVFSGNMRYFEENLNSIKKYFNNYSYKFLFFPWLSEKKNFKKFKKYKPKYKIYFLKKNSWDKISKKIQYPDRANPIINFFYMWDSLIQSFNKLENFLDQDSIIMRFRTDIILKSQKINYYIQNIRDNEIYIPDCYHWNGVNDQVFFAKVKTLKKFKRFFQFIKDSNNKLNFICPEYSFYNFLKKKKINIVYINLDYQILRHRKQQVANEELSIIPFKDKVLIKILKTRYKLRNFKNFYFFKKNRNKQQNKILKK